jgi:ribosomal protein S7
MQKTDRLNQLIADIRREAPHVGKKPYSHNIIRTALSIIADEFGVEEANKVVRKLRLHRRGFNEE